MTHKLDIRKKWKLEVLIECLDSALNDPELWTDKGVRDDLADRILDLQKYHKKHFGEYYIPTIKRAYRKV